MQLDREPGTARIAIIGPDTKAAKRPDLNPLAKASAAIDRQLKSDDTVIYEPTPVVSVEAGVAKFVRWYNGYCAG